MRRTLAAVKSFDQKFTFATLASLKELSNVVQSQGFNTECPEKQLHSNAIEVCACQILLLCLLLLHEALDTQINREKQM